MRLHSSLLLPRAEFPPLGGAPEGEGQPGEQPDDLFEAVAGTQHPNAEAQPAPLEIGAGLTVATAPAQAAGAAAEAGDAGAEMAAQTAGGPPRDASPVPLRSDGSDASGPVLVHAPVAGREEAQRQPAGAGITQAPPVPAPGSQQAPASPTSPGQCVPAPPQLMRGPEGRLPANRERVATTVSLGAMGDTLSQLPASIFHRCTAQQRLTRLWLGGSMRSYLKSLGAKPGQWGCPLPASHAGPHEHAAGGAPPAPPAHRLSAVSRSRSLGSSRATQGTPVPAGPGLTYQQVADRVRLSDARKLRQLGQPLTENGQLCPEVRAADGGPNGATMQGLHQVQSSGTACLVPGMLPSWTTPLPCASLASLASLQAL